MNSPNLSSASIPKRGQPIAPEFFPTIAECTYDWESWHNRDAELLWVNSAVERFTGYTASDCLEMDDYPYRLIDSSDHGRMKQHMVEMASGSSGNNIEFKVRHRDGTHRWVAVSWQPMTDRQGRSLGYRTSVRDIADKRELREQLRLHNEHLEQLVQERTARVAELEKHRSKMQQLAALGELAAGVAHEINNPLAGIRNALLLMKRHLPSDTKHFDKFELIDREIDRISGITHQMYQLYRPSQQMATRFSIQQSIEEVISLSQPLARKTRVKVVTVFVDLIAIGELGADEVVSREGELKQVLLNLIHNAIQASKPGQTVTVTTKTEHRTLSVEVADDGYGIAAEHLDQIFNPFFSTKTETVGQGMGLGLSVTRSIVEAMDGSVKVASEVGKGTRFTVSIPRRLE
ncbi:two-component system sensor histidine kinase NtrB [Rubripirellula reticaptiva]|uniref:histidine kinase n=1 Tax=Rubripirellula reticaptiva TaxID=2528013 RepID=A0A5C6ELS8_9BACT|nr:ATP-binding protein [Rubripirellula reticaptiva]TWU48239.1 Sensor protein ZraS [Rubripirellula reticaptiva]